MSGQVLYYFCILLCTQILIVHCVAPLVAVEVDKLPSSRSYSATTTSHLFGGYIYIFEGITNNRDGKSDEILEYSLFDQSLQVVAHFPVDPGMCCGSLIPSTDSTYYYIGGEAESRDSRIIFHFNPDNRTVTIAGELPRSAFSPIVAKTGYSTGIVITDDFEAGAELFHLEFSGDTTNVTSSGRLPLDIHFSPEPTSIWDGTQSLYIFGSFSEVDANERGYVMINQPMIHYNLTSNTSQIIMLDYPEILGFSASAFDGTYRYLIGGFQPKNAILRFHPLKKLSFFQ